ISVAVKNRFAFEYLKLLDRPNSFQRTVDFLMELFCPNGIWDDEMLASMLEELQQYSLVTLVSCVSMVTLRLHLLVDSWTQDRMPEEEISITVPQPFACSPVRWTGSIVISLNISCLTWNFSQVPVNNDTSMIELLFYAYYPNTNIQ